MRDDAPNSAPTDPFGGDPYALYTREEAAHLLNVAPRTLDNWRRGKKGPVAIKDGTRLTRWSRGALVSWIRAREEHGTTAAALLERERELEQARARVAVLEAELGAVRTGRNCNAP